MKKRNLLLVSALLSLSLLAGCGEKEDPNTLAGVDTTQYVTLGQYTGLVVSVAKPGEITDAQIQSYIDNNYLYAAKELVDVTDRVAQPGDTVQIEYVGRVDGETFEGGSTPEGETWSLTLGSGQTIPGFEDGIVGMAIDEVKVLNLTFPEMYTAELAGKDVEFTITLRGIQKTVIPELTDELVATLDLGYATAAELKAAAKLELEEEAQQKFENDSENAIMSTVLTACDFKEPPEFLVTKNEEVLREQIEYYAQMFGMDLESMLDLYYGMTLEQFTQNSHDSAVTAAKQSLALEAIADKENLSKISSDELQKEAESYIAESGYYQSVEALYEDVTEEEFRNYIVSRRAIDFLNANNTVSAE